MSSRIPHLEHGRRIAARLSQENFMVTARGASALWLVLKVLDPSRRGVLVPANVCEVVIAAILHAGLEPVYLDVDPIIGNVELRHLETCPAGEAGILIAVHHYGTPLPMRAISEWAKSRGIFVIENVCNALGAVSDGQAAGTWGDAAIYSFGEGKILDVGEGGALAARDSEIVSACGQQEMTLDFWSDIQRSREKAYQACLRTLRQYPELKDPVIYRALFQQYRPALIARANEDAAGKIAGGLGKLSTELGIRRMRADYYRDRIKHPAVAHRPRTSGEVCWRYTCHLPPQMRDGAVRYLRERKLPASTWYPAVDRFFAERRENCRLPGADRFEKTVINLWVDPRTPDDVIEKTADSLLEYLNAVPDSQEWSTG